MRLWVANNRLWFYAAAAVMAAAASYVRTPYSLMLPGQAVPLRDVVSVAGHPAPRDDFYLTDVRFAARATPLELLGAVIPGARILPGEDAPPQNAGSGFDGAEREAMNESQSVAAFVAERAAGLRVPLPRTSVLAVSFAPFAPARHELRTMDMLLAIDGHSIASIADVRRALASVRAGDRVRVDVARRTGSRSLLVRTIRYRGRSALGAYLTTIYRRPPIPIAVRFHLPDVAGGSGGLMFALDIYETLRPGKGPYERVAGTGTIAYDGSVGPIEGAAQKVVAARRAGASIFFVPRENYREVRATPGIRVVPVSNFRQALAAL